MFKDVPAMQLRKLGNSDMNITPIGFGAWAVGGDWQFGWGYQDDNDSIAAIHQALELGVNWIDTAAAYGLGHSEEVVCKALKEWRGRCPYVFTKCGLVSDESNKILISLKADSIRQEIEKSLSRLGVDMIDLYQIHWPHKNIAETEEGWAELAKLQKEGKIRWIGVCNFNREELKSASSIARITSLQPPYSLIRRGIESEILPYCEKHGIGVIVYSPMASGLLTGTMTRERALLLPKNDWRSRSADFQEPKLSQNLALVERLKAIAQRHGRSPGEVAIAWTLRSPAITGAIVGGRNAKQVAEIIAASEFRLSLEEIAELE